MFLWSRHSNNLSLFHVTCPDASLTKTISWCGGYYRDLMPMRLQDHVLNWHPVRNKKDATTTERRDYTLPSLYVWWASCWQQMFVNTLSSSHPLNKVQYPQTPLTNCTILRTVESGGKLKECSMTSVCFNKKQVKQIHELCLQPYTMTPCPHPLLKKK